MPEEVAPAYDESFSTCVRLLHGEGMSEPKITDVDPAVGVGGQCSLVHRTFDDGVVDDLHGGVERAEVVDFLEEGLRDPSLDVSKRGTSRAVRV